MIIIAMRNKHAKLRRCGSWVHLEKYILEKYIWEKYSLEKYGLEKYILWRNHFGKYTLCDSQDTPTERKSESVSDRMSTVTLWISMFSP